jgi:hypothetical protein
VEYRVHFNSFKEGDENKYPFLYQWNFTKIYVEPKPQKSDSNFAPPQDGKKYQTLPALVIAGPSSNQENKDSGMLPISPGAMIQTPVPIQRKF